MANKGRSYHGDSVRGVSQSSLSLERLQEELRRERLQTSGCASGSRPSVGSGARSPIALGRLIDVSSFQPAVDALQQIGRSRHFRVRKWVANAALYFVSVEEMVGLTAELGGVQGVKDHLAALQAGDVRLAGTTEPRTVLPRHSGFRLSIINKHKGSLVRAEVFVPGEMLDETATVRQTLGLPDRLIPDCVQVPLAKIPSLYSRNIPELIVRAQDTVPPAATFLPVEVFDMPAYRAPGR